MGHRAGGRDPRARVEVPRTPSASYERPTAASISRSRQMHDIASVTRDKKTQRDMPGSPPIVNGDTLRVQSRGLPKSSSSHTLTSPRKTVHGLGARTRSPTDSVRLRRQSRTMDVTPRTLPRADGTVSRPSVPAPISVTPPLPPIPTTLSASRYSLAHYDDRGHKRNRSMTVQASQRAVSGALKDSFESPVKISGWRPSQAPALPPLKVRELAPKRSTRDENEHPPRSSSKAREALGLLRRLSLSRSSSRNRSNSRLTAVLDQQSVESDGAYFSSRRRLSISWLKGKVSPFGQRASSLHMDSGAPPAIPKSYTAESLADSLPQQGPAETIDAEFSSLKHTHDDIHPTDAEVRLAFAQGRGESVFRDQERAAARLEARAKINIRLAHDATVHPDDCPLNIYERGEVADYAGKVFFSGCQGVKKPGGRLEASADSNFGYDDDRGDYRLVPGDHIAYRYEIVDMLGKGSFGQVARCIDRKTGDIVAVKVIRNKRRFHAQALVEIKILRQLREWDPNNTHAMIRYIDHLYFRHHLCIVTDLLDLNLYEFTKMNKFRGCSIDLVRRIATQLLSCLVLLRRHGVIHCDLKPENVLLSRCSSSAIRVIDFGSSCYEDQKVYTYIQSRFYRSPEVILGMSYGLPIDMWSVGCILAELLTGFPLFPGEDEQEQLGCIMEVFGPPDRRLIDHCTRAKLFFDASGKPKPVVSSRGRKRRPSSKTLSQALKCQDDSLLDFIARCLKWNPVARMQPDEALEHPFITGLPMSSLKENGRNARGRAPVDHAPLRPAPARGPRGNIRSVSSPVKSGVRHRASQLPLAREKQHV